MGFFRGGLVFFISVLLLFSFITMNSFLTVASSLEYENVKEGVTPIIENLTSGGLESFFPEEFGAEAAAEFNLTQEMQKALDSMKKHCQNETSYVFSAGGFTFVIPCELANETPQVLVETGVEEMIEQGYYEDYDCGFWDCIFKTKDPLSLISQKAQQYWETRFYFSLVAALIFAGLLFLVMSNRINFPIVLGSLMIISSLPMLKIGGILELFLGSIFLLFFEIFFSKATTIFWIMLILGILILAGGIVLRILKPHLIKKKLSAKDVKKIVSKK